MKQKPRLLRITTVPISLKLLLTGQFTFFQQQGFEVLTVSATGPELTYLQENKIPHQVVPMTRTISPIRDLYCLWQLILTIRHFRPNIVHTHTPKAGLLGMLAAWICRVPVRMHTIAGLPLMEAQGLIRIILKITEYITYYCATDIYPNSKGLAHYVKNEFSIPKGKLKIIGKGSSNGVEVATFTANDLLVKEAQRLRIQHQIPENAFTFCFVGRVVKDKGISELLGSFSQLLTEQPSVYLLIVGPLEQDLDPLAQEELDFIQKNNHVVMAGYQADVRPWMLAANAFVFPSYREGFPNVVMQASCLGLPCIVSDINGCNELIENGKSGWVIPAKNKEALRHAMVDLMTDRHRASQMALLAKQYITANFDRQFLWQELLGEYNYLLNRQKL